MSSRTGNFTTPGGTIYPRAMDDPGLVITILGALLLLGLLGDLAARWLPLPRVTLREVGRQVVVISIFEVAGAALCVLAGLLAAGVPPA